MVWNWQQPDWAQFTFDDAALHGIETRFLRNAGYLQGALAHISGDQLTDLFVDVVSEEAFKTSEIEGEHLNRGSLQSSIRRNLGLAFDKFKPSPAEQGIADVMTKTYETFSDRLTEQTLFDWHKRVMSGNGTIKDIGKYRTHVEPMQVVSGAIHKHKVHFEAPPSQQVPNEMNTFIHWFNDTSPTGKNPLPVVHRAAMAHLYFESIHPFEDGNGRIGRALVIKTICQNLEHPALLALSYTIQKNRKHYYEALEKNNKTNKITHWMVYFGNMLIDAQDYTKQLIDFVIGKGKLYNRIKGILNARQEKALARLLKDGPDSFPFGLNAEKYISITGTSRATATRDLQDMVDKGVVIRKGELKATRYYLDFGENKREQS